MPNRRLRRGPCRRISTPRCGRRSASGRRSARSSGSGRATPRSGRAPTRRVARLARHRRRAAGRVDDLRRARRGRAAGGLQPRAAPRHGRLEPLPGGPPHDVRKAARASPSCPVLDSTDPAQVRAFEAPRGPRADALHRVVASRARRSSPTSSSSTSSSASKQAVGPDKAGDAVRRHHRPRLEARAGRPGRRFRHVFLGGRRSAGATRRCPTSAWCRRRSWGSTSRACWRAAGDGARLRRRRPRRGEPRRRARGVLGCSRCAAATRSRWSPRRGSAISGAWLEQLLAESTGKAGKGLIPVDREPLGPPEVYGQDRLFVHLRLDSAPDAAQDRAVARLASGGPPGGPDRGARSRTTIGGGVLPLGVRDGRRGRDPRDQPVRPARRRGEQGRDAEAHGRVRGDRAPAGGDADPRGRRAPALRRPAQRRASSRPEARRRSSASCARTSGGSGRATTSRSSPTSR